ncbi:MAG: HD domain-containing phosphohydrolase [Smithellaceae bacterium]|nr:HD domain-containing phosphohydrolase [Smithellaceae bacterium]
MIRTRQRILIVPGEAGGLEDLEKVIEENGLDIVRTGSASGAMKRLAEESFKLILIEDFLSGVSGLELCRQIRQNDAYAGIPVYILTEDASKYSRLEITRAGGDGAIIRPFDEMEVWSRIEARLKMGETEHVLKGALQNINSLTTFGEELLFAFDPFSFDYLTSMDMVVKQIIRATSDAAGKAQKVILGVIDEKKTWQWYEYESVFGKLSRTGLLLGADDVIEIMVEKGKRVIFLNEEDIDLPSVSPLVTLFRSHYIPVENIVAYLSERLCIAALNYDQRVSETNALVLNSLVMQSLFLKSLADRIRETEDAFTCTVETLARSAEANDDDVGNHIIRVGHFSSLLAEKIGLSAQFTKTIAIQAQVHDIGKVHLPRELLIKPGKLTDEEWELSRRHPLFGAKIMGNHPRLKMARNIALTHHERWDGTGYPHGLKGEEIPIEGRIVSLADHYDALRNARSYKRAYSHEEVCKILLEGDHRTKPSHFDPKLLKAFKELHQKFEKMYDDMSAEKR